MDLNKKEKFIKEVLSNENHDLDTHALWKNIQPKVESKDKDRRWIIFFFLGALAMGAVWGLFNWMGQETSQMQSVDNTAPVEIESPATSKAETKDLSEYKLESNETSQSITSNVNEETISITTQLDPIRTSNNSIETNEVERAKLSLESDTGSQNDNIEIASNLENSLANQTMAFEAITIQESDRGENVEVMQSITSENENEDDITLASSEEGSSNLFITLSSIESIQGVGIQTKRLIDNYPQEAEVIKPHRNYDWIPFIQFHGGLIKTSTQSEFVSVDPTLNASAFDKEGGVFGYSTCLNLGWERNDGWYYGLGLDYTQSAVRYQNIESVLETESSLGVNAIYINRNGQTTNIPGTVSESTITNYNVSWYRQHRHINFEILIGKRIIGAGRFSLLADAGLMYGVSQSATGYDFVDSALNGFRKFQPGEENAYEGSGNMKLRSAISFNYNLNQFAIGLQALYRHDLNGITKSSNFYKTRNTDFGMRLGLTYYPNW